MFNAIKEINDSTVIISLDQTRIKHGKDILKGDNYKNVFKDWRMYDVAKRMYVSFKLESTQMISQLKYGSLVNSTKVICVTLRAQSVFIRMRKYSSHTNSSIGFFLGINPKLTLRKALKAKIDDIVTWFDLDDDDTTLLMEEKLTGETVTQEIVIPAIDIYHKVFGSGNGEDTISTTVYEIRTSPKHAVTLSSILYKLHIPRTISLFTSFRMVSKASLTMIFTKL